MLKCRMKVMDYLRVCELTLDVYTTLNIMWETIHANYANVYCSVYVTCSR